MEIHELYQPRRRRNMLMVGAAIAFLSPFTDTIYLPALKSVGESLNASDAQVAATVSAYLAACGVGQLLWGPLSDHFGRLPILYSSLCLFLIFTTGCIFATTIEMLIVLRTLEGFIVGSTVVTVQAIVADCYPVQELGAAMGSLLTPMLVGPIIAPLIGGGLASLFGWRATFVLLVVFTAPICVAAYYILPETQHWFVHQNIISRNEKINNSENERREISSNSNGNGIENDNDSDSKQRAISSIDDAAHVVILAHSDTIVRPPLIAPYRALGFIVQAELAPSYAVICATFAIMFTSLTTLPLFLSDSPYNYSDAIVGLCFLPVGAAMFLGAVYGGEYSDKAARDYPAVVEGRLMYSIVPMWMVAVGAVGFGLSISVFKSLVGVLVSQFVLGFGQAWLMPSTLGYLSAARPASSGAVGSIMFFLCFIGAGVCISTSIIVSNQIGYALYFAGLGCASGICTLWLTVVTVAKVRRATAAAAAAAAAAANEEVAHHAVGVGDNYAPFHDDSV